MIISVAILEDPRLKLNLKVRASLKLELIVSKSIGPVLWVRTFCASVNKVTLSIASCTVSLALSFRIVQRRSTLTRDTTSTLSRLSFPQISLVSSISALLNCSKIGLIKSKL